MELDLQILQASTLTSALLLKELFSKAIESDRGIPIKTNNVNNVNMCICTAACIPIIQCNSAAFAALK